MSISRALITERPPSQATGFPVHLCNSPVHSTSRHVSHSQQLAILFTPRRRVLLWITVFLEIFNCSHANASLQMCQAPLFSAQPKLYGCAESCHCLLALLAVLLRRLQAKERSNQCGFCLQQTVFIGK